VCTAENGSSNDLPECLAGQRPGAKENEMQLEIKRSTFTLGPAALLAVDDGAGTRIVCHSGVLWITQEGDVKDSIVGPGDVFTIRKPGHTVITALEPSTLSVLAPGSGNVHVHDRQAPPLVMESAACN
jgi:DUF2917 family protein